MKRLDTLYLRILSDYIHQRETVLPDGVSEKMLKGLTYYARIHNQLGIVWKQCGRQLTDLDPRSGEILYSGFQSDVFRSVCYDTDFLEVCRLLDHNRIDYLPVKGIVMKDYYPERHFRTMSDIDILVREADMTECRELMEKAGFDSQIGNASVMVYTRDVVEYEFHKHMMYDTLVREFDYQGYFDGLWDHAEKGAHTHRYMISEDAHFLFLLTHLAKHIVNEGIGIRAFMDIAILVKNASTLDWERVERELKDIYLYEFAGICLSLCRIWFGIESPLERELEAGFVDEVTHKILTDGVFGKLNRDNRINRTAKEIAKEDRGYAMGAALDMIQTIFPSYENMRYISWYSFLDGKPYLLPGAWIYRWVYVLTRKRDAGLKRLVQTAGNRDKIERQELYFKQWGL